MTTSACSFWSTDRSRRPIRLVPNAFRGVRSVGNVMRQNLCLTEVERMKTISSDITVQWHFLAPDDPGWKSMRCLYAYVAPNKKEILYIGKSWGVTVKARWNRTAKEDFWNDLERKRKIRKHFALLGEVDLTHRVRLTKELLADVESLLILGEQPWGNIQSKLSRIPRPGLVVECSGSWPGQARFYKDNAWQHSYS